MDINKYVADKIKYYRIQRNLSQEEVAEELETSAVNISRYENGDRKTNQDILFKLSQLFGVSINDFFPPVDNAKYIDLISNTIKIPVLGFIKAGVPIEAQEDIIDYVDIPAIWTKGGKDFYALKISGDSMTPKYNEGDIVIFEQTKDYEAGRNKDCAVMVNCTECTFKKVFIDEHGITLQPYNMNYEPMRFTKEQAMQLPITVVGIAKEKRVSL
ncbi:MAG: LexA family protein [Clostridia bacterium]|jgi:repressor LexA|nr:helix-turn-helix domain-containing protein [Clostridium sp.]DAE58911.1 MAG TPA: Repressor protein CI [Caudoviricetes sp.]